VNGSILIVIDDDVKRKQPTKREKTMVAKI